MRMILEKIYSNIDSQSYLNHCELQIEKLMVIKWVGNPDLAKFLKTLKIDLDKGKETKLYIDINKQFHPHEFDEKG